MKARPEWTETTGSGTQGTSLRDRLRPSLSQFAAGTTALTGVLVLLGIWTAVAGYGLTCEGRWPLCDGAVFGLFPANFGSFVEWFHRLVAMVTGFAILGTAAGSWLVGADRRIRATFTAAVVLTPIQVVLGALTVTRYEQLILASHFGTAIVILSLLVVGTVWLAGRSLPAVELGGGAAGALLGALALTPGLLVAVHSIPLHLSYYALALLGFGALLVVAASPGQRHAGLRALSGTGAALVAVGMTVGRVRLDPTGQQLVVAALLLAWLLAVGTAVADRRRLFERDEIGPAEF